MCYFISMWPYIISACVSPQLIDMMTACIRLVASIVLLNYVASIVGLMFVSAYSVSQIALSMMSHQHNTKPPKCTHTIHIIHINQKLFSDAITW